MKDLFYSRDWLLVILPPMLGVSLFHHYCSFSLRIVTKILLTRLAYCCQIYAQWFGCFRLLWFIVEVRRWYKFTGVCVQRWRTFRSDKSKLQRNSCKGDVYWFYFRPRYQVMSATPVDFSADGHKLAALIKQYDNMAFWKVMEGHDGTILHGKAWRLTAMC